MPDGDLFSRHVERGWQTAAQYAFRGDCDDLTRAKLFGPLANWAKRGCPGIDEIAELVLVLGPGSTSDARRRFRSELDQIKRTYLCASTDLAAEAALRVVADDSSLLGRLPTVRQGEQRRLVVEAILVEVVEAKITPPLLLGGLSKRDRVSIGTLMDRFHRAARIVEHMPQLAKLAEQLLQQPDGQAITRPRIAVPKPSQEDLLNLAIGSQ